MPVIAVVVIQTIVNVVVVMAVLIFTVVLESHRTDYILQIALCRLRFKIVFQPTKFSMRLDCVDNVVTLEKKRY